MINTHSFHLLSKVPAAFSLWTLRTVTPAANFRRKPGFEPARQRNGLEANKIAAALQLNVSLRPTLTCSLARWKVESTVNQLLSCEDLLQLICLEPSLLKLLRRVSCFLKFLKGK